MSAPDDSADIAIVGLACRFPGAQTAGEFWSNLAAGVESITQLTDDEILQSGVPRAHLAASNYVKAAALLDEPGGFDAAFFGITPNEARTMDPQHRILLELASAALEDAGCDPDRSPGRVGVFTGAAMNTYFMHAGLGRNFAEDYIPTLIVNDKDFLSTRISYKLNLRGPSLTVQTACSTSLVAVHLARQSLLSEETDLALAGAISIRVPHRAGYFADAGGVSSPDGHVRAFDAEANGTIFGSGGGVVVLKRLRDAIADGDTIRAVIKGSAVNNDGAEKAGYTAPSVNSQADAVIEALANADVEADSISYLETHGSGTPVGDPIEIRALTKAFRASTQRSGFCAIGSVKTNVGHLDAAAGMAGLIKTVLALQHRQLPPSLHFFRPNPEIDFPATPFFVNTRLTEWISPGGPRRAGIMATGMGGTNAHLVLEEAPSSAPAPESHRPNLFVLSARTESALAASADRLGAFLEANPSINLDDAAFTLQTGRRSMLHRRFIVAADRDAALAALAAKPARFSTSRVVDGTVRPLILLLPGVGDHYVGMGRELYATFSVFRREVDRCAEILRPLLGLDLRDVLYPPNRDWQNASSARGIDLKKMLVGNTQPPEDDDTRRLNQAVHLQPALFTIEYALARLWSDLGIVPQAIVGHSMGEYVAACLSGVFSLEDALRLIVRRTQLVDQLPPARMLAVTLPEADLQPLLPSALSISLINGPSLCVVAGPPEAVEEFSRTLTARGVIFRHVQNTHAFHSRLLDPIVPAFADEVRQVRRNAPAIPFISNVTGRWITADEATDPEYWARHTNHTARFHDALQTLWQSEDPILLEAGPGRTLGVLAHQHPARPPVTSSAAIASLRHHYEVQPDEEILLAGAGRLWLSGVDLHWANLRSGGRRSRIPLPTYPFERQTYWHAADAAPVVNESPKNSPEPAAIEIDQWFHAPSWERTVPSEDCANAASRAGTLWLVFADRHGNDHGVRDLLAKSNAAIQVVRFGEAFGRGADGSVEIDPRRSEDYLQLFREIKDARWSSVHLLHLGCVDPIADGRASDFGFFSLMQIAQAIGELNIGIPFKIAVVSSGLQQVIGDEELDPSMATALGPCGAIPREFSNIACFSVDLARSCESTSLGENHRRWLVSEFANPITGEVLAYRGRHRWRRKFLPVTLRPAIQTPLRDASLGPDRLRERGVYLITGGVGGIGLAVARHLAETCQARLVLTKKNPFPKKSQWKDLLASAETPPEIAQTLRQLLEIENLGSEVEVMVADAADLEAMRAVFHETLGKFQSINGVIHAAGFVRAGLIQAANRKLADEILAPKVQGTLVLHELLKDREPDFLVLFSSMASISCPFAHAEYSAANSFLDAFAGYSNSCTGYHTVAINWPVWKEVGVVARLEALVGVEEWKDEALNKAIRTRDGIEAFRRALASNLSQVIVCPTDLDRELAQAQTASLSAPAEDGPVSVSADEIEGVVAEVWRTVFGFEEIGIHESFTSLGGHSLLALRIVNRLRQRLGCDLSLGAIFEAPTIGALTNLLKKNHAGTQPATPPAQSVANADPTSGHRPGPQPIQVLPRERRSMPGLRG